MQNSNHIALGSRSAGGDASAKADAFFFPASSVLLATHSSAFRRIFGIFGNEFSDFPGQERGLAAGSRNPAVRLP